MANLSENDILSFLKSVLKSVTLPEDERLVERLFEEDIPENRQDWLKVFTPSIFSLKKNYERLEILGDTLLKTYFRDFLFYLNENYTESDITNLSSHYMAREGQSRVAIELGLTRYVVFPPFDQLPGTQEENEAILNKLRDNIAADIYESFIGAVATTSRRISYGLSELLCINIMRKIYSGPGARFPIEDKYRLSNVRTKIVQWLEGLGVPSVSSGSTEVKTNEKNKKMFTIENRADTYVVYLMPNQTAALNRVLTSRGIQPFDGNGFGLAIKKEGNYKVNIYYELEKLLTQRGVNQAFVDEYRISDGIDKVEGFRYVEVVTPKKLSEPSTSGSPGYAVYQLIGTRFDGSKEILYTTCQYNTYYVRTVNGERKMLSRTEIMDDMVLQYRKKSSTASSSSSIFS